MEGNGERRGKGSLKKIKSRKASGSNGVAVELLKCNSDSIIEWLLKIFNRCMEVGTAIEN